MVLFTVYDSEVKVRFFHSPIRTSLCSKTSVCDTEEMDASSMYGSNIKLVVLLNN